MKRLLALPLLLALGCGTHTMGSGVSKTEVRSVAGFTGVSAANGLEVEVHVGAPTSVKLTGDDNILPLVETEVSGDRLRVGYKANLHVSPRAPVHVDISTPALTSLAASSGVHVKASGVAADAFELHGSSGADVTVAGAAKALTAEASSGAKVDAGQLVTKTATVQASSGTDVVVRAGEAVSGDASSGSSVRVLGGPVTRGVHTSSGASVAYE